MTERPDPETAPVPGPGDADPDRGDGPAGEPVPAPFQDPDVEHPPVEEPPSQGLGGDGVGARAASAAPDAPGAGEGDTAEVPAIALTPAGEPVGGVGLAAGVGPAPLPDPAAPSVVTGPIIDADPRHTTSAPVDAGAEPPVSSGESPSTGPTYAAPAPGDPPSAPEWDGATAAQASSGAERPELLVAAAFAGGLLFALILKRLGR